MRYVCGNVLSGNVTVLVLEIKVACHIRKGTNVCWKISNVCVLAANSKHPTKPTVK